MLNGMVGIDLGFAWSSGSVGRSPAVGNSAASNSAVGNMTGGNSAGRGSTVVDAHHAADNLLDLIVAGVVSGMDGSGNFGSGTAAASAASTATAATSTSSAADSAMSSDGDPSIKSPESRASGLSNGTTRIVADAFAAPTSGPADSTLPINADRNANSVSDIGPGTDRLETIAFECLVAGLHDDRVAALLHALGWSDDFQCFAVAGAPGGPVAQTRQQLRRAVRDLGGTLTLTGLHQGVCVALTTVQAAVTPEVTCTAMMPAFDASAAVALSPVRKGVAGAVVAVRAALSTMAATKAVAGSESVRPLRAEDALPERALLGDDDARNELIASVYGSLKEAGPDDPTLGTVSAFLDSGGSLETTAKTLNVHPNTVRYRLKRAADTTGWDATNPREAYVLRTAIALGRIADA